MAGPSRDRIGCCLGAAAVATDGGGRGGLRPARRAHPRPQHATEHIQRHATEHIRRQVKLAPYPTEDVGRIIAQIGSEMSMFTSDHPMRKVAGGRSSPSKPRWPGT
jgi:hypothetical protein